MDPALAGREQGRAGRHRSPLPAGRAAGAPTNELKPWLAKLGCLPPKADGEFVWRREAIRGGYQLPYDPLFPVACRDEASKQWAGEGRPPQEMGPGPVRRQDSAYERQGTCNLVMFFEPLRGWRPVGVTGQRRPADGASGLTGLLDVSYPNALRVRLVCDNRNAHPGGALDEAFPAPEAKRRCDRLEFPPTPQPGSWPNRAEAERSVRSGQGGDRRMESKEMVVSEGTPWEAERNRTEATVRWRFPPEKARIKREELEPVLGYPEQRGP